MGKDNREVNDSDDSQTITADTKPSGSLASSDCRRQERKSVTKRRGFADSIVKRVRSALGKFKRKK